MSRGLWGAATLGLIACAAAVGQNDTTRRDSMARTDTGARGNAASADGAVDSQRPKGGPLRLVTDVSERRLSVYAGDDRVRSYSIAVGTARYPTPRGSFKIRKLIWNPSWVPPNSKWAAKKTPKAPGQAGNPMKVVKIFFREPDYYIHGTGEVESLGGAASHGCIRMDPGDAADLGRYLMEHGGQPREESWFARVLKRRGETKVIYLQRPVPFSITD